MEEKVLVKSEKCSLKTFFIVAAVIGIIFSIILFFNRTARDREHYDHYYKNYLNHQERYPANHSCDFCRFIDDHPTKFDYVSYKMDSWDYVIIIPFLASILASGLIYLWLRSYELTVTDKRIYGKVAFGNRVDLPVDSVSATATIRILKGVSVSTSSGRISFLVIKNSDEIYQVVNNLLIERQQNKVSATVETTAPKSDEADQIKKYKELLDSGIITQEEFDAKKKQLLGL